jgi:ribosomal protein S18 acetylase RimI-like enzyme
MTLTILPCTTEDFDRLVSFVSQINPIAFHHIGYFGVTSEDIRSSIKSLDVPYNEGFQMAYEGERLVGIMGADFDEDIGRAWLYGPLVVSGEWDLTADALYDAVIPLIPNGRFEHEMFIDVQNEHCRGFSTRHNFEPKGEWAIYYLPGDRIADLSHAEAAVWEDRFTAELEELHSRLFPSSNYSVAYILKQRQDNHLLLISTDGDRLSGYLLITVDQASGEAYIDLVGVHEDYRRQGLGLRLILAGLAQLREYPNLKQVNLSVDCLNSQAIYLYESLGFLWERDMVALQKNSGKS